MNDYDALSTEALEALTASETTWLPLQHIAQTTPPKWQDAAESIDTSTDSIHGKK